MVIYSVNGKFHSGSGGLSVYFPYDVFNAADKTVLSIYEDLSVSPYYLGSMAKICCSCLSAMQDMLSNFDLSSALNSSLSSWGTNSYSGSGSHYSYNYSESSIWSFVNDIQETGSSNVIAFENKPALDADGHYSFTLTQSSMDYTNDVYSNVYMWLDDKKQLFELGDSGNINADYENRKFTDNFDGNWFSLPDGQLLCADFITSSEEGELYSSPILYNGNESNLRFMYDKKSNTAYMIDICESISENGASARSEKLEKGDVIVPRYRIQDKNSEETIVSQGKEFTYTGDNALKFSKLPKGEYWYAFRIDDLFGDHLMTEPVKFIIENENSAVTFQTEEHKWIAATCTTPEYCAFCGETKGEAAGHKWKKADCDNPENCSVCGETKGKALGHDWEEATFTAPKTCKRCGKTEGEKLGKEAYADIYIPLMEDLKSENFIDDFSTSYALADINYDGVLELFVDSGIYANGQRAYTISDGSVVNCGFLSAWYPIYLLDGEYYQSGGKMGHYYISKISLDGTTLNGETVYSWEGDPNVKPNPDMDYYDIENGDPVYYYSLREDGYAGFYD